ncbi:MAG: flagellar biosynthetic protein FliO [Pseudomonadota bacterium]
MDPLSYAKYLGALAVVMGLLVLVAWAGQRVLPGSVAGGGRGRPSRGGRMTLVDALALDPKRRLVVVRVDETDHVLLLGQPGDLLVSNSTEDPSRTEGGGGDDPGGTTLPEGATLAASSGASVVSLTRVNQ